MGKRGRDEPLDLVDGRASAKAILDVHTGSLLAEKLVTRLPYPGIGVPSGRPPVELHYVGTEALFELLEEFVNGTPRLVIVGPRGFGKSSDLRALSVCAYNFYVAHTKDVLVCIWNLAAALNDVVGVVRDALVFAYLVVDEGEKLRAAAAATDPSQQVGAAAAVGPNTDTSQRVGAGPSTDPSQQVGSAAAVGPSTDTSQQVGAAAAAGPSTDTSQQVEALEKVLKEIQSINSMEDVLWFIKGRKEEKQEIFNFFVDGWELIDAKDSRGVDLPRDRDQKVVHTKLEQLFSEGKQVWFSASAKSNAAKERPHEVIYYKAKPFNDVQCNSYASSSILGSLSSRQNDIEFYTGRVPLFLDVLCYCCTEFSRLLSATARSRLLEEVCLEPRIHFVALRQKFESLKPGDIEIAELMQEDDNWQMVLKLFREHEEIKQVEENIKKIKLDKSCHDIKEMGDKDATYFIFPEKRYCSSFVHRMYVEGFRAKEAEFLKHAGEAWIPYCRYLLKHSNVNWSDVGWVVEDLVAEVVTNRRVHFGTTLGYIAGASLKLEEFTDIPAGLLIVELLKMVPGHGRYWKPRLFNFPYIDGVISYLDMQGILHIIGLQTTVSVDDHLISARLFMSSEYLKTWFPDLKAHLAAVKLHFVYVGFSKEHGDAVVEKDTQAQAHKLKSGKSYGVEAHKWTFVPLANALRDLDGEEIQVVGEVARRRQLQLPQGRLEMAALYPLKRKELNEIAEQYGLDHKQYLNKEALITALLEML